MMTDKINYDAEKHEYNLDGLRVPSVTELAGQFSKLNTAWLDEHPEYAARGTLVHEELAEYYSGNITKDQLKYDQSKEICEYLEPHKDMKVETIVYNTEHGYAGTADIICMKGTTVYYVVDFKSGNTRKRLYEQCQLSLYLLALESMGYDTDNAQLLVISPDGITKYPPLSWDKMVQLEEGDLELEDDESIEIMRLTERLKMLQPFVDEVEQLEKMLKDLLAERFEQKDATTFVCNDLKFVYSKPSVRKTIDTLALKKAGLYEQYVKETPVAASVRITKRKNDGI